MSKHLDVLQHMCVLTKGSWSPRALKHLLSSMVFSCTPPEHCIYRSLQVCSYTDTFMAYCIGQLKTLSKAPLNPQASSKVQLPWCMSEELSTRPLSPSMLSKSKEQRRKGPWSYGWCASTDGTCMGISKGASITHSQLYLLTSSAFFTGRSLTWDTIHSSHQRCLLFAHLSLPAASLIPSPSHLLRT